MSISPSNSIANGRNRKIVLTYKEIIFTMAPCVAEDPIIAQIEAIF